MSNTNEVLIRPEPVQEDQTPVETDLPLPDVKLEQIEAEEEPRPSERCAPEVQLFLQLLARAYVLDHCALAIICNAVTSHAQPRSLAGQTDVIVIRQAIWQTMSSECNLEAGPSS